MENYRIVFEKKNVGENVSRQIKTFVFLSFRFLQRPSIENVQESRTNSAQFSL